MAVPDPVTSTELAALINQPPAAAVAFFEAKGLALTWNWHDQWQEAHSRAFTVAKVARMDILSDIYDGVRRALVSGELEVEFKKRMGGLLQQKGWWGKKIVVGTDGQAEVVQEGSPRRLSTIYRTNLQSAYMAGRWQQFAAEADEAPYVQYVAIMDGRTRPGHARFNGKVFRFDDPAWKVIAPPNGFNCRCRIRNLDAGELKQRGLKAESGSRIEYRQHDPLVDARSGRWDGDTAVQRGVSVPDPVNSDKRQSLWADRGLDYNPGDAGLEHMRTMLARKAAAVPPALSKITIRDLVSGPEFSRWFEKPSGEFPVAVIAPENAALIGTKNTVAVLSPESHAKQVKNHPDVSAADYARAQEVIDQGIAYQDSPVSLVYVLDDANGMTSVVKATRTGNGLFLTSLRHLPSDPAQRATEIRRIEKRAALYEQSK